MSGGTDIPSLGELVSQGAEARVYKGSCLGRKVAIKERFRKAYRHPILDGKLTVQRLNHEVRALVKAAKAGVDVPGVVHVDKEKYRIYMEWIEGTSVKNYFNSEEAARDAKLAVASGIGEAIAKLHNSGITHGDLTTSNLALRDTSNSVVLIDFGLSSLQSNVESFAVDLYVLQRAIASTHRNSDYLFDKLLESYLSSSSRSKLIEQKYSEVRARGRKREAFG